MPKKLKKPRAERFDHSTHCAYVEMTNYAGYPHYRAKVRFDKGLVSGELPYKLTARDAALHSESPRRIRP